MKKVIAAIVAALALAVSVAQIAIAGEVRSGDGRPVVVASGGVLTSTDKGDAGIIDSGPNTGASGAPGK